MLMVDGEAGGSFLAVMNGFEWWPHDGEVLRICAARETWVEGSEVANWVPECRSGAREGEGCEECGLVSHLEVNRVSHL